MDKPNPRIEIEERVALIRRTYGILVNENSRDAVTSGMLANIGELLDEVDYWRAESMRLQNTLDELNNQSDQNNYVENSFIPDPSVSYECPECKVGMAYGKEEGITWDIVGRVINVNGNHSDIGYIHCSVCGKDSPLYASPETAFINWCI